MKSYVFVYGTLRKHEANYRLLENTTCIAEQCWTYGKLYDTGLSYPVMVLGGNEKVYGEVYEVSTEDLHMLDRLEGYNGPESNDNLYERMTQFVTTDIGEYKAYVYVEGKNQDLCRHRIEEGDWKVYRILNCSALRNINYFAYGSCMDDNRFKTDGYDHFFQKIIGCGNIQGYSLEFTRRSYDGSGRADIVENSGYVEGKVYEIPSEALSYLYRREGVNIGCYRPVFVDINVAGKVLVDVLSFVVINKEDKEIAPPKWYGEEILNGAKGYVSDSYLEPLRKKIEKLTSSEVNS